MPIPYDMYDDGHGTLVFRDAHPSHEGKYICQTEPLTDVSTIVTLSLGEILKVISTFRWMVFISSGLGDLLSILTPDKIVQMFSESLA